MEKIPHFISNCILHLKCGYGIVQKYWPIWGLVSVSELNQNSDFDRTLLLLGNIYEALGSKISKLL